MVTIELTLDLENGRTDWSRREYFGCESGGYPVSLYEDWNGLAEQQAAVMPREGRHSLARRRRASQPSLSLSAPVRYMGMFA